MRGLADDPHLASFEALGAHVLDLRVAAGDEAGRGTVVGIGEVDAAPHVARHRQRSDDGIAAVFRQRVDQGIEPAHLHGAVDLQLLADESRQIDVETGRIAVAAGIVERWVIDLGEKADDADAREVRTFRPPARVPESGHAGRNTPVRLRHDGVGRDQHRNRRKRRRHHPS